MIEETARHRKLIFGMWEFCGYGPTKTKITAHHEIMTSLSPFLLLEISVFRL